MINYAKLTRPRSPYLRPLWMAAALAGLLAIMTFAFAIHTGHIQHFIRQMQAVPVPVVTPAPVLPTDPVAEQRAVEITQSLRGSWSNALLAIEKANSKDVTILEFHPDFSKGAFEVQGEAKSFGGLLEYLKRIRQTGLLDSVELAHEEALVREHVETIGFTLKGQMSTVK